MIVFKNYELNFYRCLISTSYPNTKNVFSYGMQQDIGSIRVTYWSIDCRGARIALMD